MSIVERKCEHGAQMAVAKLPDGSWMGGVSHCGCCYSAFGYIDSGGMSQYGQAAGRFWNPKDRCAQCGGAYVSYGATPKESHRGEG